jgi:REP element-mobilizing transposase RayT
MAYDPKKHHRRSIRLKGYDYSKPGWYYLTICTFERNFLFGEIANSQMRPSMIGTIAQECWNEVPKHFPRAALDVSVVMPNHLHGILIIEGTGTGTPRRAQGSCHGMPVQPPQPAAFGQPVSGSLATIVGQFKQAVTRRVGAHLVTEAAESPQSPGSSASYGHATPIVGARHGVPKGMPWHARTNAAWHARTNSAWDARTIIRGGPLHIWHENYYEHIIRNEKELNRIREYICTNPLRWPYDVENPACQSEAADDIEELLAADDDEL